MPGGHRLAGTRRRPPISTWLNRFRAVADGDGVGAVAAIALWRAAVAVVVVEAAPHVEPGQERHFRGTLRTVLECHSGRGGRVASQLGIAPGRILYCPQDDGFGLSRLTTAPTSAIAQWPPVTSVAMAGVGPAEIAVREVPRDRLGSQSSGRVSVSRVKRPHRHTRTGTAICTDNERVPPCRIGDRTGTLSCLGKDDCHGRNSSLTTA